MPYLLQFLPKNSPQYAKNALKQHLKPTKSHHFTPKTTSDDTNRQVWFFMRKMLFFWLAYAVAYAVTYSLFGKKTGLKHPFLSFFEPVNAKKRLISTPCCTQKRAYKHPLWHDNLLIYIALCKNSVVLCFSLGNGCFGAKAKQGCLFIAAIRWLSQYGISLSNGFFTREPFG